MNKDLEHLRYLSIGFCINAGITALFSLLPLIHVTIGALIAFGSFGEGQNAPPAFMGLFFMVIGGTFIVLGMFIAILNFLAARFLAKQTKYMFCIVLGGVNCMFAPFGTILGVFTIIVLLRESVKELFEHGSEGVKVPPAVSGWQ
jgi:hypothetical protein